MLAAKYGQHLPLTRQSAIYAREGVEIDVSTLADWVGAAAASLMPLVEAIRAHVFAAERMHGDDTTVPVLAKERTRIGRLWVLCPRRPAVRRARLRRRRRSSTRPTARASIPSGTWPGSPGIMQADAYGGFNRLYEPGRQPGPILEAACWAHARRKLYELAAVAKAPIAAEAVRRIDRLFAVERDIAGLSCRGAPGGPRGALGADPGRARALAAAAAGTALAQVGGRQGDRLHDQALGKRSPGS